MATRTVRATFRIDDVLVDPTSATLADMDGVYGVRRTDTNEVVVSAGTAMTRMSLGVYSYSFTSVDGVAYTASVKFVHGGNEYYKDFDFAATTPAAGSGTYLENLIAARDGYTAKLAEIQTAPDYRWNEYEQFLIDQIEKLDKRIVETETRTNEQAAYDQGEVISGGYTP